MNLQISIESPVTARCTKCKYQHHGNNKYTFPARCPECTESSMVRGREELPVDSVRVCWGHYNLADFKEKQAQYLFTLAFPPAGLHRNYVVGQDNFFEIDELSPLEVAIELREIYDKYIYTRSTEDIRKVIAYLESNEKQNRTNLLLNSKSQLEDELFWIYKELQEVNGEENA